MLILGGGSPKNFILQTEPQIQEVLGLEESGHDYFLQVTDARPDTGGLSGATPQEAMTWGKVDPEQLPDTVTCYLDSTVALPLLTVYALASRAAAAAAAADGSAGGDDRATGAGIRGLASNEERRMKMTPSSSSKVIFALDSDFRTALRHLLLICSRSSTPTDSRIKPVADSLPFLLRRADVAVRGGRPGGCTSSSCGPARAERDARWPGAGSG